MTQPTPYSLVFGEEFVLRLEIQLPLLSVAIHEEVIVEAKSYQCLEKLEALYEDRLLAQLNLELNITTRYLTHLRNECNFGLSRKVIRSQQSAPP